MADKIRGLTVEIAADASQFKSAMSDLKKDAKSSQAELSALQKSLKLEYNEDKLKRAQEIAQKAIDETAAVADGLRMRLDELEKTGNVDTAEYRKLQSELAQTETKSVELKKSLEQLNNLKFDNLSKQFTDVGNKISGAGKALTPLSVAAGATIGALGATGAKAIKTGDELATLATKYDTSAEAIQKFNYVALQTDVDADNLYKGLVKVRSGIADIATGTTSAASSALQNLKLDFNAFNGSEEQFYAIIDALASMENKTEMVAIANDIFGDKLANNLLPMIYAGTDAITAYCAEYDELGGLTNEQVASLTTFDNVLNKIKTQLGNIIAQIGTSLLPLMESVANVVSTSIIPKLQRLSDWFYSLTLGQQKFALAALAVVAALAPLAIGIGKVVTAVGSIIKILPQLNTALTALAANPIILIIAAIAAILVILYTKCEAFRESINNLVGTLGSALQPILNVVISLLNTVMELLTPIIELLGEQLATVINVVTDALQPLFDILSVLFELLTPLLDVALIPLKLALNALKVPLQLIGSLLGWLTPLFEVFGKVVGFVMKGVIFIVNLVLGWVEDAVNFVIGILNALIDGVNAALGWLGVHIDRIGEIKLRLDTSEVDDLSDVEAIVNDTPTNAPETDSPTNTYDTVDTSGVVGDVYNYDYSKTEKTQNVTVTIQNYAEKVDVDDLVRQINIKLAEAM